MRLETLDAGMLDSALVANLPVAWIRERKMLPIRLSDGGIGLLISDPSRVDDIQAVSLAIGVTPSVILADPDLILDAIEQCYVLDSQTPSGLLESLDPKVWMTNGPADPESAAQRGDLLERSESTPVAQLTNLILLEAVKQGASDIHLEPYASRLTIRYRIDGVLHERASPPKHLEQALVSRIKVMARMDIAERRLPQDGMAQVRVGERAIDIRVSTVPVADGERVVLRLLNRANAFLSLEALGMDPTLLRQFNHLVRRPNGMLIVSGPTGSGKTTTLYAALGAMNARRQNILTIEEPVEYRLPGIGQIQVQPKIGLSFASGLRHILRQDPDVVLVGEVRDLETAEIAVRASLTGHMVLTTLHTNDAPAAIMRLVDMGVEAYLLASCLRGVLGQRLIRRLCSSCCIEATLSTISKQARLPVVLCNALRDQPFRRASREGCDQCLEGFSGRVGIFELMPCDTYLSEAIHAGKLDANGLRTVAMRSGMTDLLSDGLKKVRSGLIDPADLTGVIMK